jgi:hypothetical protein
MNVKVNELYDEVSKQIADIVIIAIIAAHNEDDITHHVIGDLIDQGTEVYFIDNSSIENTVKHTDYSALN